ncbi:transglycosylase SLT domain-containing protein [Oceanomicrobium pacificus]|uniref:Lytic transglycosylase n=1 Tax=Oceanomicrobium pacificus TaxID=2692916 RepID=A0A6B0TTM0_9RHOB|nr:lytic transglycosylase [Oceanomicrobium pacificus]MXU64582.1 lytic transglycosylase [Oceanomicrobium pacificus]
MRRMAILLVLALASCGASGPPSNLDNACAIKDERPGWHKAMTRTERKWGVPVEVQMATLYQESKYVHDARTPRKYVLGFIPNGRRSTAYGFSQAIDGTWDWYQDDTGKRRAKRTDFSDSSDFIGWYMHKSWEKNGIAKNDAYNQYLAYHQGHAGYARGSYRNQRWLINVARSVQDRAVMYGTQLNYCNG